MEYYIRDIETPDGPYDLLGIMRKIRKGTVNNNTLLSHGALEEPRPASEFKELEEFFQETTEQAGESQSAAPAGTAGRSFSELLQIGLEFIKNTTPVLLYSGIYMLFGLIIAYFCMYRLGVTGIVIGIALCFFLSGSYFYGMLRYVRGNPIDVAQIFSRVIKTALPMGVVSLIVAMLALPGVLVVKVLLPPSLIMVALPILFIFLLIVLTVFAFTPLFIVDRKVDFWDAMRESVAIIRANNWQNLGNVFGLVALNFILFFAMPVVLPLTAGALIMIYDES